MEVLSKQFSKREKVLIVFLALIIVCAVYYFFVHQPVTDRINNAVSTTEMLTMENDQLSIKEAKKQQMLAEVDTILENPDAQEVPKYDNLSELTAFLNTTLKRSMSYDITCGDVQFDEESGIYRRPVNIQCNVGSYEIAKKIINDIKTCPYCSQVIGANFSPYDNRKKVDENGTVIPVDNIEDDGIALSLSMTFYETR